eukprot:CAMPEP_0198227432 /NCGR_PEP_ID=MMETSP1445-20131203/109162_1 /TAXON_ID=36898 /ORGANISM="Pyramimonas sp., Strain CCMP2087" /LENGTH=155 /DNA_ID=CAMNT_0043907479 /DNA_START=220 /DNA_END=687 /DNA_ORIENTATION=+
MESALEGSSLTTTALATSLALIASSGSLLRMSRPARRARPAVAAARVATLLEGSGSELQLALKSLSTFAACDTPFSPFEPFPLALEFCSLSPIHASSHDLLMKPSPSVRSFGGGGPKGLNLSSFCAAAIAAFTLSKFSPACATTRSRGLYGLETG